MADTALKIDKNIPVPVIREHSITNYLRKLGESEDGSSIYFPKPDDRALESYRANIRVAAKRIMGANFTTRKETNGIRVWKVKPQ